MAHNMMSTSEPGSTSCSSVSVSTDACSPSRRTVFSAAMIAFSHVIMRHGQIASFLPRRITFCTAATTRSSARALSVTPRAGSRVDIPPVQLDADGSRFTSHCVLLWVVDSGAVTPPESVPSTSLPFPVIVAPTGAAGVEGRVGADPHGVDARAALSSFRTCSPACASQPMPWLSAAQRSASPPRLSRCRGSAPASSNSATHAAAPSARQYAARIRAVVPSASREFASAHAFDDCWRSSRSPAASPLAQAS